MLTSCAADWFHSWETDHANALLDGQVVNEIILDSERAML